MGELRAGARELLGAVALALTVAPWTPVAAAEDAQRESAPAPAAPLPFPTEDAEVASRWRAGLALELAGRYLDSARVYAELVERLPTESHLHWRIARNHYLAAKALPFDEKAERRRLFLLTEEWAARGIATDPECAECYLYRFIGLSRVATTDGILSSARRASEMAALLDRAFELGPTHVDNEWNSELANLHYAAGVFYRSVPEGTLVGWTVGVRGDLDRAIEQLRRANLLSAERIDYRIELGAALLCAAQRRGDATLRAEGIEVLAAIPSLPTHQLSDEVDREHARRLISEEKAACDYSRERFGGRAG